MRINLLCFFVLTLCTCVRGQIIEQSDSRIVEESGSQTVKESNSQGVKESDSEERKQLSSQIVKRAGGAVFGQVESQVVRERNGMRWRIQAGGKGIVWRVGEDEDLPHGDNIEMSGRGVSMVVDYQVDSNRMVKVQRRLIYPQMRPFIKDNDPAWWATYRNYLRRNYEDEEVLPKLYHGAHEMTFGALDSVSIGAVFTLHHAPNATGISAKRTFFPDPTGHLAYEKVTLTNTTDNSLRVGYYPKQVLDTHAGETGGFHTRASAGVVGELLLLPGGRNSVEIGFMAGGVAEIVAYDPYTAENAYAARQKIVSELQQNLTLETPEPIYNTMFSLAKIRGAESIFDSKLGLVHSPGGERYYIGFWANDQAEYINPFFPYLGYDLGNEAALNMWRVYAKAIPEDGSNIRYSFEMEGDSPANPLDRGDAAMIAYGLSHYLLALGDEAVAKELWPLLAWCLEYNHRQLNGYGVVASESDEMEGRIETGDANLSTSSLYYGALETSISLGRELGQPKRQLRQYQQRREALAAAIETFFGRTVEGLETYRYFAGHNTLRHWICLPLVVGLHDRAAGTLEGLFERLWTDNGVAVEANHPNRAISKIFWDRGTLYALRGAFIANGTKRAHERLLQFSRERLLGERVPYVVEAYPEGGMAHLSAENGLYCRIFTEGIFGMLPTGFRAFRIQPRMPEDWNEMALRNIYAFGQSEGFDLEVSREGVAFRVRVVLGATGQIKEYIVPAGEAIEIKL